MPNKWDKAFAGDPFVPNPDAHNLFLETARIVQNLQPALAADGNQFDEPKWCFAKTTSSLSPGTFSSPTSCTFNAWEVDESSGSTPKPLIVTTDSDLLGATLENYWNITVASGTQIAVMRDYLGKWHLVWADC